MQRRAFFILPALALAACSSPEDVAEATGVDQEGRQVSGAQDTPVPPSPPDAPATTALVVNEENELYNFDFAYPREVAVIPALKAQIDAEMEQEKAELIKIAREGREAARDDGFPYNAYASGTTWQVVADTPRFLSLSTSRYSYTGGAHPNTNATSLVWDREAQSSMAAIALFTSPAAFDAAVKVPYCAALNAERRKRRAGVVDEESIFSECPPASELAVMPASSGGKAFDRIRLVAAPYVAGPYAEGEYKVTIPVTQDILSAVKPAYKLAFKPK